jgi:hypothetical protein
MAEFVYNNTPSSTTGVSPFYANKGYHPWLTIAFEKIPNSAVQLAVANLAELHEYLKGEIRTANESAEKFTNMKRRETPKWREGQKVWLSTENIRTKRKMKKLDWKKLGPFEILERVSTHAYKLKLPTNLKGIHNVFHVNLLKLHEGDDLPGHNQGPPPPVEIEGDATYEVEQVLDSKYFRNSLRFLVRWTGYGPEEDSWEPLPNLDGAIEAVREYQAKHPGKPHATENDLAKLAVSRNQTEDFKRNRKVTRNLNSGPTTSSHQR